MTARVSAQPITLIWDLFPPPPPFQVPPPPASDLTSIATGDLNVPCRMSGSAHEGQDPLPPAPELQFQIAVGRYVGPTNPDGTLVHAAQMIQDGTLGPFAELTLVFYESILTGQLGGGCTPPRHRLMYNGQWLADGVPGEPGTIQSFGRGWRSQTFRVPISWVRFPAEPGPEPGIAPTPAVNDIHIAWDPITPLALACNTCMAVSSMSQRQWAASPVILIHGTGQESGWWTRHGGLGALLNNSIAVSGVDFSPNRNTTDANATALQYAPGTHGIAEDAPDNRILVHAVRHGSLAVHLVCHSKGGLDARLWIARLANDPSRSRLRVLSLSTLSTPHNGSALADFSIARWGPAPADSRIEYYGIPVSRRTFDLMSLLANDGPDYRDLQTAVCAAANSRELPLWPSATGKGAIAADIDENESASVDASLEVREMRDDTDYNEGQFYWLVEQALAERRYIQGVNNVHRVLRFVDHVKVVTYSSAIDSEGNPIITRQLLGVSPPGTLDTRNDALVTVSSGLGHGSFATVAQAAETVIFAGPEFPPNGGPRNAIWAHNHSSVGGVDPMLQVIRWLVHWDVQAGRLP